MIQWAGAIIKRCDVYLNQGCGSGTGRLINRCNSAATQNIPIQCLETHTHTYTHIISTDDYMHYLEITRKTAVVNQLQMFSNSCLMQPFQFLFSCQTAYCSLVLEKVVCVWEGIQGAGVKPTDVYVSQLLKIICQPQFSLLNSNDKFRPLVGIP